MKQTPTCPEILGTLKTRAYEGPVGQVASATYEIIKIVKTPGGPIYITNCRETAENPETQETPPHKTIPFALVESYLPTPTTPPQKPSKNPQPNTDSPA